MELSSPRFKALTVTAGLSFWFFIITTLIGKFYLTSLAIFVVISLITSQIFAVKLSRVLDIFAMINTKIFLGSLFVFIISIYGIFFKILRIDLLRLKNQKITYWINMKQLKKSRLFKQY